MSLRFQIEKLEDVDEPQRALYVPVKKNEDDEKPAYYQLDVDGAPDPQEVQRLRGHNTKLLDELKEVKKRRFLTPEETKKFEELQQKEALFGREQESANREAELRINEVRAQTTKELEAANVERDKYRGLYHAEKWQGRARQAILAKGGNPDLLLPHVQGLVVPVEDEHSGEVDIRIKDTKAKEGDPKFRFNSAGAYMSIEDLVANDLMKSYPQAFDGVNADGGGATGRDGRGAAGRDGVPANVGQVEEMPMEAFDKARNAGDIQ